MYTCAGKLCFFVALCSFANAFKDIDFLNRRDGCVVVNTSLAATESVWNDTLLLAEASYWDPLLGDYRALKPASSYSSALLDGMNLEISNVDHPDVVIDVDKRFCVRISDVIGFRPSDCESVYFFAAITWQNSGASVADKMGCVLSVVDDRQSEIARVGYRDLESTGRGQRWFSIGVQALSSAPGSEDYEGRLEGGFQFVRGNETLGEDDLLYAGEVQSSINMNSTLPQNLEYFCFAAERYKANPMGSCIFSNIAFCPLNCTSLPTNAPTQSPSLPPTTTTAAMSTTPATTTLPGMRDTAPSDGTDNDNDDDNDEDGGDSGGGSINQTAQLALIGGALAIGCCCAFIVVILYAKKRDQLEAPRPERRSRQTSRSVRPNAPNQSVTQRRNLSRSGSFRATAKNESMSNYARGELGDVDGEARDQSSPSQSTKGGTILARGGGGNGARRSRSGTSRRQSMRGGGGGSRISRNYGARQDASNPLREGPSLSYEPIARSAQSYGSSSNYNGSDSEYGRMQLRTLDTHNFGEDDAFVEGGGGDYGELALRPGTSLAIASAVAGRSSASAAESAYTLPEGPNHNNNNNNNNNSTDNTYALMPRTADYTTFNAVPKSNAANAKESVPFAQGYGSLPDQ